MITLNLVENNLKKEIAQEKILVLLKLIFIFFVITALLICLLVMFASRLLEKNLSELKQQNSYINTDKQTFQQGVGQINTELQAIEIVQKENQNWTEFLAKFTQTVPRGVRLADFSLNKEKESFNISGTALTRDDFLLFKKQLEESGLVSEIDSPLTNLLSSQNVSFSLSAKLNTTSNP